MRNRYKWQNLFKTSLNSVIPAWVATDTTEKYFDIVDAIGIDAWWAYVNFQDSLERERIRFHRTSNWGTRLYYYEYWRETPAQSHTTSVYVQINNVAEYVNFLWKNIDDIWYVEQLEDVWLRVKVCWWILQHSWDTQVTVSDTILTMADDTTNYIYINYVTGTIHVSTTMPSFPLVATVVTASWDITSITDNRSLYVWWNSTGAPTTFTQLSDTPANYSWSSRKFVMVKNDLSWLEFSNEFWDISTDSLRVTNWASFGSYITIKNLSTPDQPWTPVSGNTTFYVDEATKKIKYKEDDWDVEIVATEDYVDDIFKNSIFWDWSDWDVTITTTVTLTRDMYYNNLTITSPWILIPDWYVVYIKWTLSGNWKIQRNWNNWTSAVTTTPWVWWAALNAWTLNADYKWWDWWSNWTSTWAPRVWEAWESANPSYSNINWVAWWSWGRWDSWNAQAWGEWGTTTRWNWYNRTYTFSEMLRYLVYNPWSYDFITTSIYKWISWSWGGSWGADDDATCLWGAWWWAGSNWWVIKIIANIVNWTWTFEAIWGIWGDWAPWYTVSIYNSWWWGWGAWGSGWILILLYWTLISIWTKTLTWGVGWIGWWWPYPWWIWENWNNWTSIEIQVFV